MTFFFLKIEDDDDDDSYMKELIRTGKIPFFHTWSDYCEMTFMAFNYFAKADIFFLLSRIYGNSLSEENPKNKFVEKCDEYRNDPFRLCCYLNERLSHYGIHNRYPVVMCYKLREDDETYSVGLFDYNGELIEKETSMYRVLSL